MLSTVTFTGTVISAHQIETDDGRIIFFAAGDAAKQLNRLLKRRVTVTGSLEQVEGAPVIKIQRYRLLD